MGITINHSLTGPAALLKLGIHEADLTWFVTSGGQVKLTAAAIELKFGSHVQTMPVTITTLTKLSHDKLTATELADLKMKASSAFYVVQELAMKSEVAPSLHKSGAMGVLPTPSIPIAGADFDELEKKEFANAFKAPADYGKVVQPAGTWPVASATTINNGKPVKLRDATAMYQPVHGTSPGSRYFVVAASADLRVAARYANTALSVRIEGPGFKKHTGVFSETGFSTVNIEKGYASLHLEVGEDVVMANKTLSAILGGLGLPLETPIPNVKVIKGLGA